MDENKEDEALKTIQNMYKKFNVIYATYAKMSNENEIIVICLVRGFEIRDKKTTDLLSTNTWLTLNQLDIRGQKIILKFSKEPIEFLTADSQTLFESICDVLQRVLLPNELEKLNFSRFNAYPVLPTPFSIRKRFSMMKKETDIDQYDESETIFDDLLKIGSDVLDLSKFPKLTKLILEILPMFNFIKYLIIPKSEDYQVYQQLDTVLPNCRFLRHIKVSNKADTHFSRFLTTIINSTSNISSLSFGPGTSLTIEDLKLIRSKIVNSRIHSLELNNSLEDQVNELGSDFYSLFDGQLGTQLWSLNMRETKKIDFDILLPKLRFITSLSFANCDIEIDKFFVAICENDMQNLTYLNLDKNDCAEKIPKTLKFPSSLTHISVNDVSWKKNSLVTFFQFFMKQKDEIHLSIARAKSYDEQWIALFEYLSTSKCSNFHTFIWDRNQIQDSLINFLKQNKKISYLSMSGCFSNSEPSDKKSLILSMFEYIKEAPNLKTLVIEGTNENFLGEKFPVIIDACLLHPSLSVLDLAYSRCGNVGIAYLIPLIKRGKLNIQVLNIEGAYVQEQDENVCIKLFKELTESASDVFVSFPQKENEQIFEHRLLKQKQKFQLLFRTKNTLLSNDENENESENDKYAYKKFKNTPFYLYPLNHYSPEIFFPIFFEESEHKKLNFEASKRLKAAQERAKVNKKNEEEEEEPESESGFAFVDDKNTENGGIKFSDVPQRDVLQNIVKKINSPKSPNDIEDGSMLSSETESQVIQNKSRKYDNNNNEDSSNSAQIRPLKNSNKSTEKVPEQLIRQDSPKNNNNNNNNNGYMLSEFNKREIISFKEKYKINKSAITFPKLKNPNQIMDEKWNKIDENYSLESLYEILKSQRNTVPK